MSDHVNDPTKDSATGRVFKLLHSMHHLHDDMRTRQALATGFRISEPDTVEIYVCLGRLVEMLDLAEAELRKAPAFKESLHLRPIVKIRDAVARMNLGHPWKEFKGWATPALMIDLEHAVNVVESDGRRRVVDPEEIDGVRRDIALLIADLLDNTDLPKLLVAFMVKHLRNIDLAFDQFQLYGSDGLGEALERLVGSLAFSPDVSAAMNAAAVSERPETSAFWTVVSRSEKVVSLTSGTSYLLTAATPAIVSLIEAGRKLLGAGTP